jgi:SAM-dependent methyltransferase
MNLIDIINRTSPPSPWAEGEKIPWNEPGFSTRMLREHLSQEHDAASRRSAIIDRQVEWLFQNLLGGRPTSILDLGCGPGLYSQRLASRGCHSTGIDFSPASIAYARQQAEAEGLDCTYIEGDLRNIAFGTGFGMAMFIYGELNVFRPEEARLILQKAHAALQPGGLLVLEVHTFQVVEALGKQPPSWHSTPSGLFSPDPHLFLHESFWDAAASTATERYIIIDALTGAVTRYAATTQAYREDQYRSLVSAAGFQQIEFHPSLEGKVCPGTRDFIVITARK